MRLEDLLDLGSQSLECQREADGRYWWFLRDGPMTVSGTLGDWREDETRS